MIELWEEIEFILKHDLHCRACDGFGCDHKDNVKYALEELHKLLDSRLKDIKAA